MNFCRLFILGVVGLVLSQTSAGAQDAATMRRLALEVYRQMTGTIRVEAKPVFRGGELNGCSLEFNALIRDFVYAQGNYTKLAGSFALMKVPQNVAFALKIVVDDLDMNTLQFAPAAAPVSAYLVSGNETTKASVLSSSPSDTPGGVFVVHKTQPALDILIAGLQADKLTIAFARIPGGSDVMVDIETDVQDTDNNGKRLRSPKIGLEFLNCAQTMIGSMRR